MHCICNFICGLSDVIIKTFSQSVSTCTWDKSNCSVICTLFKITFRGKWDERGERPFLWPFSSFPDRHTFCAFCPVLSILLLWLFKAEETSGPVALRLAVWRMARATSERSGGGSCSQYYCYDTIRDDILTYAQKPTRVSLIYGTEPATKKWKTEKLKSNKPICSEVSVNSPGNPWSQSGRRKGRL